MNMEDFKNGVGDVYLRWIVGGVITICLGLATVLWNQSAAQISDLKTQVSTLNASVSDMKGDTKVLTARQQEISDKLSELIGSNKPNRRPP